MTFLELHDKYTSLPFGAHWCKGGVAGGTWRPYCRMLCSMCPPGTPHEPMPKSVQDHIAKMERDGTIVRR